MKTKRGKKDKLQEVFGVGPKSENFILTKYTKQLQLWDHQKHALIKNIMIKMTLKYGTVQDYQNVDEFSA